MLLELPGCTLPAFKNFKLDDGWPESEEEYSEICN